MREGSEEHTAGTAMEPQTYPRQSCSPPGGGAFQLV